VANLSDRPEQQDHTYAYDDEDRLASVTGAASHATCHSPKFYPDLKLSGAARP
jgi:YD repeat-containing protein